MIVREWRGRADPADSNSYPRHFREAVLPELRGIDGFLGAMLGRRDLGDAIEFVVLTRWRSMEAIEAFAGSATENAVVEPAAAAALLDYDRHVRHYEVVEDE